MCVRDVACTGSVYLLPRVEGAATTTAAAAAAAAGHRYRGWVGRLSLSHYYSLPARALFRSFHMVGTSRPCDTHHHHHISPPPLPGDCMMRIIERLDMGDDDDDVIQRKRLILKNYPFPAAPKLSIFSLWWIYQWVIRQSERDLLTGLLDISSSGRKNFLSSPVTVGTWDFLLLLLLLLYSLSLSLNAFWPVFQLSLSWHSIRYRGPWKRPPRPTLHGPLVINIFSVRLKMGERDREREKKLIISLRFTSGPSFSRNFLMGVSLILFSLKKLTGSIFFRFCLARRRNSKRKWLCVREVQGAIGLDFFSRLTDKKSASITEVPRQYSVTLEGKELRSIWL